jgi:superfamily II DNA or RNA helicase
MNARGAHYYESVAPADTAGVVLDSIARIMRANLPAGISPAYFEGFFQRNRPAMYQVLKLRLGAREVRPMPGAEPAGTPPHVYPLDVPPELWGAAERTRANLRAMEILASKELYELTDEDRLAIAMCSGWGGLSIERVADRFPAGFPVPDARSLIHEYYTPSKVADEVARVVVPLLPELVGKDGLIYALEPSAGIGRFLRAFYRLPLKTPFVRWTAVELSQVSGRLLDALFPGADVHIMPFERWLRENGHGARGQFNLLVSNPPYCPRGALMAEDPDKEYRVKQAYLYFVLRGLELLAKGGIGVFLIPSGLLTSARHAPYRERVLKTHHLMTAYRLPSESLRMKDPIFPGANLVTDLLFFRARGGKLAEVPAEDRFIVEGRFYEAYPHLILGEEHRDGEENDDHSAKPRRRYAVIGDFAGLPSFEERPMATGVFVEEHGKGARARGGVTREIDEVKNLPEDLASAVQLGLRVDRFLTAVAKGDTDLARDSHVELKTDLEVWKGNHGNPHQRGGLLELARKGVVGAERFLAAWTRSGELQESIAAQPTHEPVYRGEPTLLGQADWLYRSHGHLTVEKLAREFQKLSGRSLERRAILEELTQAGWCLDGDGWNELVPEGVYYTGDLWPKVDRCRPRAQSDRQASVQLSKLMAAIKPAVFEDLVDGLTPRESWLPVEIVQGWVNEALVERRWGEMVKLERDRGLLKPAGVDYERFARGADDHALGIPEKVVWFIGYANHHLALFRPPQPKEIIDGVPQKKPLDEVRLEIEAEWEKSFREWLKTRPDMAQLTESAYNRSLRGFVSPTYSSEPIYISRWTKTGPRPFDYQNQAARRILANRCGLLAFDVGLGKTYTGIAILARARQEGWARRPVVVVPNSIVWKWFRDFSRCLPDYRVLVIGSKRKVLASGARKGKLVSDVDTPAERAEKWSAFQAGRADVVLLTYSALGRTKVDPDILFDYVDHVSAIQRRIALARAKARSGKKGLSEREQATLEQSVEGWIAERLEANSDWEYDPGIEWHSLGIDFLMVDESQNFKNLFMPEEREGGIPDAMGGTEESKRSWQLDFRCASVRAHTGGSGVVLLSATPAKNGPVEFYNAVHLINPSAWEQVGITDPEAFIDRYCAFEKRPAQTPDGKLTVRQACVAFKNLHELRDVVFRYADFKTAEDVGLKIPDAQNHEHRVDLDEDQVEAIRAAWAEIRELREEMKRMHGEAAAKMREALRLKIQGIAMRVDLIAIHPSLPGTSDKSRMEVEAIDPHSGKIDAVVEEILATDERVCPVDDPEWCLNCGHIVFCENIAVHYWIRKALIEAGIPAHRIAILNARDVKDPESRQQIAEKFNGVGSPGDEDYEPPAFDVVIANSVAYEGVDLQRRTCAIHHIDLPWDPATLQQRNGRGVRQGNQFQAVKLHYYLGRPSGDGRRLTLIDKKRSWMASLVKSQDRVTNNPAAAINVSIEDILLDIVPPEERERVLREREEEASRLAEQRAQRARIEANRMLSQANARFRRAEQSSDPAEAGRLRQEGDALLQDLTKIDPAAWPWLEVARRVRNEALWIPEEGPPLWTGLRVRRFGRVVELGQTGIGEDGKPVLGVREMTGIRWRAETASDVNAWAKLVKPEDLEPVDAPKLTAEQLREELAQELRWHGWPDLGFHLAPAGWLERWWPEVAQPVVKAIAASSWRNPWVPFLYQGQLRVAFREQVGWLVDQGEVLPPSEAGWKRFLELAPASGHKFTDLEAAGKFWWGRRVPRDLLSRNREKQEGVAATGAA